ncbi:endonuclease domain-containing 1 protein-like [Platysternon megacephalum]|uniref:Endonuclease domain-containing 1 protein-like n=1 Tax=Platysternon megacephalum TaxID=55544 RepID=A0A4D9DIS2_9SAUR|nr:endonuclease domain-containing 1 protein-like [Platysternon megacephalum]
MSFLSLADWHGQFEEMYKQDNLTCVLAPASAGVAKVSGTWDRVCTLQEQKHLPDSGVTAKGWRCVGQACGYHGYDYRGCNTSHSGDWDYCCTEKCTMDQESNRYDCSRGDGYSTKCSPQYSTITVSGKACRADHPCGLYEKSCFWCYIDYQQNWEYCCSPQHYCGDNGYSYQWCYIQDTEKSWQYSTP